MKFKIKQRFKQRILILLSYNKSIVSQFNNDIFKMLPVNPYHGCGIFCKRIRYTRKAGKRGRGLRF